MIKLKENPTDCEEAAELLKAVAHPLRLGIVAILCDGEQKVCDLAEILKTNQSIVSQHLRILRMRKLVGATRKNGFSLYRLIEPHLKEMVSCLQDCLSTKKTND
jgi:ArsR family transcriptional regulator